MSGGLIRRAARLSRPAARPKLRAGDAEACLDLLAEVPDAVYGQREIAQSVRGLGHSVDEVAEMIVDDG